MKRWRWRTGEHEMSTFLLLDLVMHRLDTFCDGCQKFPGGKGKRERRDLELIGWLEGLWDMKLLSKRTFVLAANEGVVMRSWIDLGFLVPFLGELWGDIR